MENNEDKKEEDKNENKKYYKHKGQAKERRNIHEIIKIYNEKNKER